MPWPWTAHQAHDPPLSSLFPSQVCSSVLPERKQDGSNGSSTFLFSFSSTAVLESQCKNWSAIASWSSVIQMPWPWTAHQAHDPPLSSLFPSQVCSSVLPERKQDGSNGSPILFKRSFDTTKSFLVWIVWVLLSSHWNNGPASAFAASFASSLKQIPNPATVLQ